MIKKKTYSLADFGSPKAQIKPLLDSQNSDFTDFNDKISNTIVIQNDETIDIPRIHQRIKNMFVNSAKELSILEKQLNKLNETVFETIEEQVLADNEKSKLIRDIERLEKAVDEGQLYETMIAGVIEAYDQLVSKDVKKIIGEHTSNIDASKYIDFKLLIAEFVSIARQFNNHIKVNTNMVTAGKCPKCNNTLVIYGTKAICGTCSHKVNIGASEMLSNNINMSSKSEYYRCDTFNDYITSFQGLNKKPVPPEVYQTIYEHCNKYKIDVKTLTKTKIHEILSKNGMSEWYNFINLISNKLTGSKLPNIRKYEENLKLRHSIVEKEYVLIRGTEGRKNFLQNWYVLLAFLIMEGYEPDMGDFIKLETRDAVVNHDKIMKKICERIKEYPSTHDASKLNWNFNGIA